MRHRHELTDEQWARLEPLLPTPKRGPQPHDRRRLLNGMLWMPATGAPWRDLPERYGPWQTVASQGYRWVRAGVWQAVLAALQQQADVHGQLDWSAHFVDGTVIRAHQHATSARRITGSRISKRSDAAGAAFPPSSISAPRAVASPSPSG